MIKIDNLTRIFPTKDKKVVAIDGVSLSFPEKGMVFISGDSGSGKSTLLNLIAGFDKPTSGSIRVDGKIISSLKEVELDQYHFQKIGFVFQNYSLIENSSVYENIAFGLKKPFKKIKDKIDLALNEVGLTDYGDRLAKTLSGGEKQRVALARAIIKKPKIVLADEPCGNLDGVSSKLVLDILKSMSKDSLILIVSHNLNDAYYYGDRIIKLEKGKLVSDLVYSPSPDKEDDYVCIDGIESFDEEKMEKTNLDLANKSKKGIYRRKDFFKPIEDIENEDIEVKEDVAIKQKGFLASILRLLNRPFSRIAAFSLIIGIVLSIFSISFSIEHYDGNEVFARIYNPESYNSLIYSKGAYSNGVLQYSAILPFEEEDVAILEDEYEGNYYPLLRVDLSPSGGNRFIRDEITPGHVVFLNGYAAEIMGLLVCDEDFAKQNLGLDELEFLVEDDPSINGVYVTDYIADCFHDYFPTKYPNREDVIGMHQGLLDEDHLYIKNVIITGYETKLEALFDDFHASGNDTSVLASDEHFEEYAYLRDSLSVAYSFDKDFLEHYEYNKAVYKFRWDLEDDLGYFDSQISQGSITYCKGLEDNQIMVVDDGEFSLNYPSLSIAQVEEVLNQGSSFTLTGSGYSVNSNQDLVYEIGGEFEELLLAEAHLDLFTAENCGIYSEETYFVSENVYNRLKKENIYAYSYYLDDINEGLKLKDKLRGNSIYVQTQIDKNLSTVNNAINMFGNTFTVITIATLLIAVISIVFYGVNIVRNNSYNIGVLKALGYRGGELNKHYLFSIGLFFILICMVYAAFYSILLMLINKVVINALTRVYASSALLANYGLFDFNLYLFLAILAAFVCLLLVSSLIYLFVLRKIRVIKILQNKE